MGPFSVRPARAHSCGCKSQRELDTVSEAKRNCDLMDKNRIEAPPNRASGQKTARLA